MAKELYREKNRFSGFQLALHIIFIVCCATYIIPFMLMLAISFSTESDISRYGYTLFPRHFTLDAYRVALANPTKVLRAYGVTIFYSIVSSIGVVVINSLMAYPLSRPNFKFKGIVNTMMVITMFISGGMVSGFISNTKWYHLGNTIWIYILPGLVGVWNVIIIRTFFKGLPDGLVEAAKMDGASETRICFQICMPLCVPCMATIFFMNLVGKWNDWATSQMYITNANLYSLQYLLQRILREMEFVKGLIAEGSALSSMVDVSNYPTETVRYALAVVVAGPIIVVFPFFQKYFAKGITVGSLKG